MRVPDELLIKCGKEMPENFKNSTLKKLYKVRTSRTIVEDNLKQFHENNLLNIKWFEDLNDLKFYTNKLASVNLELIVSYTNLDLIFFYYNMVKILDKNRFDYNLNETLINIYNKKTDKCINMYNILIETLGVLPVYKNGLLDEVLCVEKPINHSSKTYLHREDGPVFNLCGEEFYFLFNYPLSKEMWGRILKTVGYDNIYNRLSNKEIMVLEPIEIRTMIIEKLGVNCLLNQ